jgi:hypothetical protein
VHAAAAGRVARCRELQTDGEGYRPGFDGAATGMARARALHPDDTKVRSQ